MNRNKASGVATSNPVAAVDTISDSLCSFLKEQILAPGVEVNPDTELSLIGVDSFSLMELILFIERRYGLTIPAEALTPENLRTIHAIGRCCEEFLKHR